MNVLNVSDARVFEVSDPVRHKKGFTLYKVTSRILPKNSSQRVVEIVTWKRYSDFSKLHHALSQLHHSLYLKGTFPVFPDAKLFGRFECDVVEERRIAALNLLNFVAQHPPLFTNAIFLKFFEGASSSQLNQETILSQSQSTNDTINCIQNLPPPLQPQSVLNDNHDLSQASRRSSETYFSPNSTPNHSRNTSVHESLISDFDPLNSISRQECLSQSKSDNEDDSDKNWLIFAIQSCDNQEDSQIKLPVNPHFDSFPNPFTPIKVDNQESISSTDAANSSIKNTSNAKYIKEEELLANQELINQNNDTIFHLKEDDKEIAFIDEEVNDDGHKDDSTLTNVTILEESHSDERLLSVVSDTYLVDAATLISQAQHHEEKSEYEAAFESYKCAVGILLEGANQEVDTEKKASIRRKTFQYLTRAEFIYDKYLKQDDFNMTGIIQPKKRWDPDSPFKSLTSSLISTWFGSLDELKKYKVIGVIGKTQIVEHVDTNHTFIIKVIYKSSQITHPSFLSQSSSSLPSPQLNIIPQGIPHMVQLYRIFKAEYALFLLLEFAKGGRLWDEVESSKCNESLCPDCTFGLNEEDECDGKRIADNTYSGRRLSRGKSMGSFSEMDQIIDEEFDDLSEMTQTEDITRFNPLSDAFSNMNSIAKESKSYTSLCNKYALSHEENLPPGLTNFDCHNISDSLESIDSISEYDNIKPKQTMNVQKVTTSRTLNARQPSYSSEIMSLGIGGLLAKAKGILKNVDDTLRSSSRSIIKNDHFTSQKSNLRETKSELNLCDRKDKKENQISEVFHQLDQMNANYSHDVPLIDEKRVKDWLSQIIICLQHLHKLGIIYCDLKPDNLLLNDSKNILVTYKCFWDQMRLNCIDDKAVQQLYVAPEVSHSSGKISHLCDWWSLGVIAYEMLTSRPLHSFYPNGINSHTHLYFPQHVSLEAKDLLTKLLQPNPSERIGIHGPEEITMHPFFSQIDWRMDNS